MHRTLGVLAAVTVAAVAAWSQPGDPDCGSHDDQSASVSVRLSRRGGACLGAAGGFSDQAGSFAGLSAAAGDYLGLGETLRLSAEYGVRLRRAEFAFTRPFLPAKRLEAGFSIHGQRFSYNQGRDASIFAFSRDVSQFESFNPDDLMNYVSRDYGAAAFVRYALDGGLAHVRLSYGYDVTGITPLTPASSDWFGGLHFLNDSSANVLSGIRTSKAITSYVYNTVDSPFRPTRGVTFSASVAVAGFGGDVNTIEPAIDVKWFHRGFQRRHVVAAHLDGRLITGYGGKAAPPFDRYYMGGEDEVRGFASWSVSPIAYEPSSASVPVLNPDGTPRTNTTVSGGVTTSVPVVETIPVYRPVSIGGDTKVVGNLEYRIPLVGPLTLALFTDAGVDRVSFGGQMRLDEGAIQGPNGEFAAAGFADHPILQSGSQILRMSSGVELQAILPEVHVPVRFYWAYNTLECGDPGSAFEFGQAPACNKVAPPPVANRSYFPNYPTFANALAMYGTPSVFKEPRSLLRIAVGFSF